MTERSLTDRLFEPINIAPIVCFRMAFGLLMAWNMSRYFFHDKIARYYLEPEFLFKYYGFEWVEPMPGIGLYIHFAVLVLLALLIAAGVFYRVAAALFFIGFTYVFLLDQTYYLNHYYFISLLSVLLIVIPAHRWRSVDAARNPDLRSQTISAWTLWILRFQIGVVYFYGGIAKLEPDWLAGQPIGVWLQKAADTPVIGPYLTEPWAPYFFAWGGMIFDLLIVPLLLWRRTRVAAFVVAVLFHLTNATLFNIGVFPWMMIAATLIFFPPDWKPFVWLAGTEKKASRDAGGGSRRSARARKFVVASLGLWVFVQLTFPLRHHFYPGPTSWTDEGHRFAWRMKLRSKHGQSIFFAVDDSGRRLRIDPSRYVTQYQWASLQDSPDMILQFAKYVDAQLEREYGPVEIHGIVAVTLNTRKRQLLVDPEVDLAAQPRTLAHSEWIMEFRDTPLGELMEPWLSEVPFTKESAKDDAADGVRK